jgi:phosphatidylglycerophosphate synthase
VDGKLARVTVTSSRFGNVLDHGIDLVHPPLWYAAWGIGLSPPWSGFLPLSALLWLMLAGYVCGRLCEGVFHLWIGRFSMFLWQPLDSFNRLITARRNPNLILLTVSWLAGQPGAGLGAVVAWHLLSTAFLAFRCLQAWRVRARGGVLQPWLERIDPVRDRHQLAVRVFTRVPAEFHAGAARG